jgi:hypothetical protein
MDLRRAGRPVTSRPSGSGDGTIRFISQMSDDGAS